MSLDLALGFFIVESGGKPSYRFFQMLFTRLKKFPSLPWLLSVLIIKACCMLSNTLTVSMETIWRRQWHPTPVLLPGKSHGRRSLTGCSPWGRQESDMTERLDFHFSLSWIGEGNGNPLPCSCLENPREREAWWASIYGVSQSRTQMKRLSSSSIEAIMWGLFFIILIWHVIFLRVL